MYVRIVPTIFGIRYEKQARVSPTPNGGARVYGH